LKASLDLRVIVSRATRVARAPKVNKGQWGKVFLAWSTNGLLFKW